MRNQKGAWLGLHSTAHIFSIISKPGDGMIVSVENHKFCPQVQLLSTSSPLIMSHVIVLHIPDTTHQDVLRQCRWRMDTS